MKYQIISIFSITRSMNCALYNRSVQFWYRLQIYQLINNIETLVNYGLWLFNSWFATILTFYKYFMNTICCNKRNTLISPDVIGVNKFYVWIFHLLVFKHLWYIFINMITFK